jgi:hypothetical protein
MAKLSSHVAINPTIQLLRFNGAVNVATYKDGSRLGEHDRTPRRDAAPDKSSAEPSH